MKTICLVIFLLTTSNTFSQDSIVKYQEYSNKADSLYNKGKYLEAIENYNLAIKSNGMKGKVMHRYRLAASYCELEKFELALDQIEIIVTKSNFNDYEVMSNEKSFLLLHDFDRWKLLMLKLQKKIKN